MIITYKFTATCETEIEYPDMDYFKNNSIGQLNNDLAQELEYFIFDRVSIDNLKVTIKGGDKDD